jgi:phytoene dehydrogenase-like protein
MTKKISIIGAGVSGLCAGIYLQMNGFKTKIFELNTQPGGLMCAWQRKDYTIEGCLHWLVGSGPSHGLNTFWNELLDMGNIDFVDPDVFMRVEDEKGRDIRVFTCIDRLEEELLAKAPEDRELIQDFTKAVRKLRTFDTTPHKALEIYNILDGLKMTAKILPYLGVFRKWHKQSLEDVAGRCRNSLLAKTIRNMFTPETAVLFVMFTLAWMDQKAAGYPIGGSMKLARMLEKRYQDLGGHIHYASRVKKILVENNKARGIQLENGIEHRADIVISAADGHATIFGMLGGRYIDDKIKQRYEEMEIFPSYLQVSLGVGRTFKDEPSALMFPLQEVLVVDEKSRQKYISVRIFNFDPTLAPEGKTLLTVMLPTTHYEHWTELRKRNRGQYLGEKRRIADTVIEALEKRFGDIEDHIEMVDISTPATVIRYTNNWKGSFEGWQMTPEIGFKKMSKTLPGLDDFYHIGQWVEPGGGVPTGMISGRNVTQIICKREGKKFTAG